MSGATLPRFNFCIAFEELRPVCVAAMLDSKETGTNDKREQAAKVTPSATQLPCESQQQVLQQGGLPVPSLHPLKKKGSVCALQDLDRFSESAGR